MGIVACTAYLAACYRNRKPLNEVRIENICAQVVHRERDPARFSLFGRLKGTDLLDSRRSAILRER
jgi:hypothetical protein